jgi:acyl carrier protein
MDYQRLYEIASKTTSWRPLGRTIAWEGFPSLIWEDVFAQKIIHYAGHPDGCLGLIALIHADPANQVAHLSMLVDDEANHVVAGEAVVMFLEHVFENMPFRKVYVDTTTRSVSFQRLQSLPGARIEARLTAHVLAGGKAFDLYTLGIHRADFLRESARLRQFVHREQPQVNGSTRMSPSFEQFTKALAAEVLDGEVDPVLLGQGGTTFDDLGIDSLAAIEVVTWLEEEYGVYLTQDQIVTLRTLQDIYTAVDSGQ